MHWWHCCSVFIRVLKSAFLELSVQNFSIWSFYKILTLKKRNPVCSERFVSCQGKGAVCWSRKRKRLAVQGVNVLHSKQWTRKHLFHFWTSTCCFGGALILLLLYCHYCWFTLNAVGGHSNQERIHKGIFLTSHTNKKQDWKRERVCVSERESVCVCVCVWCKRERAE